MDALVTGAAGFIGSNLCRRLAAEGYRVRGLDDLSDGSLENLSDVPALDFIEADLRDLEAVTEAAGGVDVIFHQGAKRSVPRSLEQPVLTTEVNVGGTLNVLLAAKASGARVVAASSSSVYGEQDVMPQVETMFPRPRSPYAASKLAGEAYCHAYWVSLGVPAISMRYFNVYGPGQSPESEYAAVVPKFIVACMDGTRPVIHGDGEQARDFTFIDDVVEANLQASRAGDAAQGRAFNIGGGAEPTSINRILALAAGIVGATPDPIWEPARAGDVRRTDADITSARELLGFDPQVRIEDGMARTVASFTSNGPVSSPA
ncbi:MAG: UDP-glucose 4-epimerase [Actinomycetota bacterium]|jgi:UDP-glucose 4-epimerase|nr:UDP-glucose 4-epimerase [Actinomycetota bacterium]